MNAILGRTEARFLVAAAVLALSFGSSALANAQLKQGTRVPAAQTSPLAPAKALIAKGNHARAIEEIEKVLAQKPENAEARYLLGEAYYKSGNQLKARKHLRMAVRLGRGSAFSQKANNLLMKLPSNLSAPRTGPETRLIASMLGLSRLRGDGGPPRPTVIDFYASWCQPCREMDKALEKVRTEYGDKVNIMKVDIEDPKNDTLVDQYEVSPIPTVVFLNSDGEVVTYAIGYAENNVTDGIKKILGAGFAR